MAGAVREPAHELDAVHVAFVADAGQQAELGQVTEDLAGAWEGRIKDELPGPRPHTTS